MDAVCLIWLLFHSRTQEMLTPSRLQTSFMSSCSTLMSTTYNTFSSLQLNTSEIKKFLKVMYNKDKYIYFVLDL